ncbi:CcdB family protein [Cognatiyoonia sp. IB215182]|uniref:CcdB family protein n=1 Tax=Cognatiyoonia sp. IB215182 TaxID=3097353 RepID=UPI002A0F4A2B|nr:CcdB family protein [Cognatiyoonia sp. IB215182]MDX8354741.1 CcdB family protein [Cognatiyoonia sp. IB215182]
MPKYDVFRDPSGSGFLLDVQTDLLSDLNTRVVVPLLPKSSAPKPATRLNPSFDVDGEKAVMVAQFLAAVPVGILGGTVRDLSDEFEQITNAMEMIIQGF